MLCRQWVKLYTLLYKGVSLTATFYVVKGTAANAIPLLSWDLCLQLGIGVHMHGLIQDTTGVVMLPRIHGNTQCIIQRQHDCFNGVLSTGYTFAVGFEHQAFCTAHRSYTYCTKSEGELQCLIMVSLGGRRAYGLESTHVVCKNGDIRLCTDFRSLGKYVKREQFQLLTFKEVACW